MPDPNGHRGKTFQLHKRHALILLACVAFAFVALLSWSVARYATQYWGERTLPTQTSTDGSWTVTIRGKRTIFGSIEVTCQARDAGGKIRPWSVVDSVTSWDELHRKYSTVDFEGDVATAAGRPFALRPGVNRWPRRE